MARRDLVADCLRPRSGRLSATAHSTQLGQPASDWCHRPAHQVQRRIELLEYLMFDSQQSVRVIDRYGTGEAPPAPAGAA